jgi:hypothetical protein
MLEDMVGPGEAREMPLDVHMEDSSVADKNFSISCELGLSYPSLLAMMRREVDIPCL